MVILTSLRSMLSRLWKNKRAFKGIQVTTYLHFKLQICRKSQTDTKILLFYFDEYEYIMWVISDIHTIIGRYCCPILFALIAKGQQNVICHRKFNFMLHRYYT